MRRLLVVLVVLGAVLVAADLGAAAYAEQRVASELRAELGLAADPEVRISGLPFLTQAARGRYEEVAVRAAQVPAPGVGDVDVRAVLRGVDVPASALLSGALPPVRAEAVRASVRIDEATLGALLGVDDLRVAEPATGTTGATETGVTGVELTGTVELGPVAAELTVRTDVEVVDGALVVTARDVSAGGPEPDSGSLGEQLLQGALRQLSATIDPAELPLGFSATSASVQDGEILLTGAGADVLVTSGS